MTYDEFNDQAIAYMKENAPEYEFTYCENIPGPDNMRYSGFYAMMHDDHLAIGISTREAYEDIVNGKVTFKEVMESMLDAVREGFSRDPMDRYVAGYISDYDKVKQHLIIEAIPVAGNEDKLSERPYKIIGDIAFVYGLNIWKDGFPVSIVYISNEMLDMWDITEEQLKADAMKYAPLERRPVLADWYEFVEDITGERPSLPVNDKDREPKVMYGTTLTAKTDTGYIGLESGASVILFKEYLEKVSEALGGSFYMIPLSSAQLLFMPEDTPMSRESMENTLKLLNRDDTIGIFISDNLYWYDKDMGIIEMLDAFDYTK